MTIKLPAYLTQVTFELVEVTQQIKGAIVKNNKMGEHI